MTTDLRAGRCPLCDHREVLVSEAAEFGHADSEKRMSVTYEPRWVLVGRNPRHGHGALSMYVCRGCGYVQWFARDPGDIPVGDEYSTRIVSGKDKEGPYR